MELTVVGIIQNPFGMNMELMEVNIIPIRLGMLMDQIHQL